MTTLYCAICGEAFEPDTDHYWVDAELRRIDDRNGQEEYALHTACWERLTDGWMEPA
jgi:hypothetical protein